MSDLIFNTLVTEYRLQYKEPGQAWKDVYEWGTANKSEADMLAATDVLNNQGYKWRILRRESTTKVLKSGE